MKCFFLFWIVFVKICCLLVSWLVNKFLHQKIRLSFSIVLKLRWAVVQSSASVWYQIFLIYVHLHLVLSLCHEVSSQTSSR